MLLSFNAAAASMEETFQQAAAAYQAGDYAKAGNLFMQAGDIAAKSNPAQAGMIWGNAGVALLQGEQYAQAAEVYEKILKLKGLSAADRLNFAKNLFFCRSKLEENALLAESIINYLHDKPKIDAADLSLLQATLGDAYRDLEYYSQAEQAYGEALKSLGPKGDAEDRARILTARGLCQSNLGLYAEAESSLQQAYELARQTQNTQTMADTCSNLGIIAWEQGRYDDALNFLNQAVDTEQSAGLTRNIGVDKNNIGLVYKSMGSHVRAMDFINDSINIAREVQNTRDEGIATVNRALLYRIGGNYAAAGQDYNKAVALFKECGFKEGLAGAYLGMGRMAYLVSGDADKALALYQDALGIYEEIGLPRAQAETLIQIAEIYKNKAKPHSATRDLALELEDDDDTAAPGLSDHELAATIRDLSQRALDIAEPRGILELIWSAHQELGYAAYKDGDLQGSYKHYMKAVDIVGAMYVSVSQAEMFGEYMAGKEDLYSEAQTVCGALYEQTGDPKYLDRLLQLGETLRNEIQKASAALANVKFIDKDKEALFNKLSSLQKAKSAAQKSIPEAVKPAAAAQASAEDQADSRLRQSEIDTQQQRVEQLDADYEQALAEWEQQYPGEKSLFDSRARVNIQDLQANIGSEDVVLLYTSLSDRLLITAVTQDKVNFAAVEAPKSAIDQLIRDDYSINYLENDWPRNKDDVNYTPAMLQEVQDRINKIFGELYSMLIKPVSGSIAGKKRLYVVSDGFISQLPFASLVSAVEADGTPVYLIEDYDISYLRPSFIEAIKKPVATGRAKKLFAMANADNTNFPMALLEGSIAEVANVSKEVTGGSDNKDLALEQLISGTSEAQAQIRIQGMFQDTDTGSLSKPSEVWLREKFAENSYEILYFATHGMPYSDTYTSVQSCYKYFQKQSYDFRQELAQSRAAGELSETLQQQKKGVLQRLKIAAMSEDNLKGISPLNAFLYLSSSAGQDILTGSVPESEDGLLTAKEILELPDQSFSNTRYVILSACNTAVTYAPKALRADMDTDGVYDTAEVKAELTRLGFLPGVDQVSFVDTFMRKGVQNVYGNFWFVDDSMSSELMSRFFANLSAQGDQPDAVVAFNAAQRSVILEAKQGRQVAGYKPREVLQPYLWAPGAIFGK